jgi:hypothetical protein
MFQPPEYLYDIRIPVNNQVGPRQGDQGRARALSAGSLDGPSGHPRDIAGYSARLLNFTRKALLSLSLKFKLTPKICYY